MNLNSGYGAIAAFVASQVGPTFGKIFVVMPTSHGNYSDWSNLWRPDDDSVTRFYTDLPTAAAACMAGRGDVIVMAPGTYTLTAALSPVANTTFLGASTGNNRQSSVIITGDIADLITIEASYVSFKNCQIVAAGNTADRLVKIADLASVVAPTFDNVIFDGADRTTVVGISLIDGTFTTTGLVVKNCLFKDLTGTCIAVGVLGMPYAEIAYNQFALDVNSGVGISLADTGAFATGKGYRIYKNDVTGFDATADEVFITVAGTENATGAGIIRQNYGAYVAPAMITIDKLSLSEVQNYYGDAATGGILVDPGT